MRYRTFPATGDEVSVLGFGAMGMAGWFGEIDDRDPIRALHTALDLGVNLIDTARARPPARPSSPASPPPTPPT